ncbi:hypothetical protein ACFYN3_40630 [Streptomyces lavendulae]|uniref:hypothetical protein n=1 Tax=Streptomyces lavendulae TaxID=1914 RepID=UPI0036802279
MLDGQSLPDPTQVTTPQLAAVIRSMESLAAELAAEVVTDALRLAQYRRLAELGEWLTTSANSLHASLTEWPSDAA